MSRITRFAMPALAMAALAFPPSQAHAVNSLAYTWTIDCANPNATSTGPLVTMASGTYLVTVTGACSYGVDTTHSVPVTTCVSPVNTLPCLDTGMSVNNVPGYTCVVGGGIAHAATCPTPGAYVSGCGGSFTVVVNEQCLSAVPNQAGLISHGGGAMTARTIDSGHYNNIGAFVVTAVWTPL